MPANAGITPQPLRRPPGMRFSAADGVVLVVGAIGAVALSWLDPALGFFCAFTVLHFFLFCNVFRIRRNAELLWAGTFLANAGILFGALGLPAWVAGGSQAIITLAVLVYEVRQPTYHGIGYRRWNTRYTEAPADPGAPRSA